MTADAREGLPVLTFASAGEWDDWLTAHGAEAPGVWLRLAKQHSGVAGVSYAEALEHALRHGWIDGQTAAGDARYALRRFTHRRPRSRWSQRNREAVERMIDEGRMTPAGLAEVEAARADGRWERAYAGAATITVPPDLREALDAAPEAARGFEALDGANRYAILYRVHDAKRPETRARRIATFVKMLIRGERIHP